MLIQSYTVGESLKKKPKCLTPAVRRSGGCYATVGHHPGTVWVHFAPIKGKSLVLRYHFYTYVKRLTLVFPLSPICIYSTIEPD